MYRRVLVVCVGNICRSPLVAQLLQRELPACDVSSAGLAAVVGSDINIMTRDEAEARGVTLAPHMARQLTRELCREAEVILVMEPSHREGVAACCPEARGKTFLLAQGMTPDSVPDPYRRSPELFRMVHDQISEACIRWAGLLSR